jgi:serine protease Do
MQSAQPQINPRPRTNWIADQAQEMLERVRHSLVQVSNEPIGGGAGIIWRTDGLILTNHHVIASRPGSQSPGKKISVWLDGQQYAARVLASHPEIDLALIKIDRHLPQVIAVADSHDLQVGQLVFAMGHPWGQAGVVTAGVISALIKTKTVNGNEIPLIRSDALLAPGNSGGPLVNAAGGVIGINTLIIGGDQCVAIPSHLAQHLIEQI